MDLEEGTTIKDVKQLVIGQFSFFLIQIASLLITSCFLAIWVVIQYLMTLLVAWLQLSGIDKGFLQVFQLIFSIATLIPIIYQFFTDIRTIVIRAYIRTKIEWHDAQKFMSKKMEP